MKKETVNLVNEFHRLSKPCELCKIADRQNFRLKKSQHADREYIIQLLEEIKELKNKGYDGVILNEVTDNGLRKNREVVALNLSQIKTENQIIDLWKESQLNK